MKKTNVKKWFTLFALCVAGSVIYELPYLSYTYYDIMIEAFGITDGQMGNLMSAFGLVAMICYFPGGWIADRFSARNLLVVALVSTGILGLWISTFPSYPVLMSIYILWGVTLTLPFWAAMLKATRLLGDSDEQGRLYGILEAGRGLIPIIYGLVIVKIFHAAGEGIHGFRYILISYSILNFIGAAVTFIFIDKKNVRDDEQTTPGIADLKQILKMPSMWYVAGIIFASYCMYASFSYITPYLTELCGMNTSSAAVVALIRTYGIALFGGLLSGVIADKMHSKAKVIIMSFVIGAAGLAVFLAVQASESALVIAIVAMLITGMGIFMTRGIYFATIDEVQIPVRLTGAAIGFASLIGFAPEAFVYGIIGRWLDNYPAVTAYRYLFSFMLVCAIAGVVFGFLVLRQVKKIKADGEQ